MEEIKTLQAWLESLPEDLKALSELLVAEGVTVETRKATAGMLNYLFKVIDLIPDGTDEIGYIDEVLTLRISSLLIPVADIDKLPAAVACRIKGLQDGAALVRELVGGDLFERFNHYTVRLKESSARGRSTEEILEKPGKLVEVRREVEAFCKGYTPPQLKEGHRLLIKLRAFLDSRLPR